MTTLNHSSVTDAIVGKDISELMEEIFFRLSRFISDGKLSLSFEEICFRPICVPISLGLIEDRVIISKDMKRIDIYFNINYDLFLCSSAKCRVNLIEDSIVKTVRDIIYKKFNKEMRNEIVNLIKYAAIVL